VTASEHAEHWSLLDTFKDGGLELEFVTGDLVTVAPSRKYEAWGIVGEGGSRVDFTDGW
jgi:hypothetical protein